MLYKGDCLKVMPELISQGVKVDLILCDLPYGTTACKWDTVIPFEPLWDCYKGLIKDNGAIVLFGSQPFTSALVMSNIKWFKYEWIWDKVQPSGQMTAKYMPMKLHENICVFYNEKPIYNRQFSERKKQDIRINAIRNKDNQKNKIAHAHLGGAKNKYAYDYNPLLVNPKSIIIFSKQPDRKPFMHPTQKPVPLFEYLIRTYTNEGDLVLDNCAGSGTTAIACMNTNRKYICIEQDDKYFQIMQNRIKNHVIQTELKLTT